MPPCSTGRPRGQRAPSSQTLTTVLTLPDSASSALSIRAKALLFRDPGSVQVHAQVERVARTDATVLVIGETGTGKELIARHVHQQSGRKGPFIAVNCGAFSENLIDAELFGHEAGAFTGASQARAGWFEAADGGTLFLDEIGDLPLALQVKLLRVLQERQVVRLGSRRPIALDVRLVAATNIDLRRAVEARRFRADLYYRLNVAPITLPPLRERPGDILPLAAHFISFYGAKLHLGAAQLSEGAQAVLLAYPWPGNIRELENAIHFALIVCRGDLIRAQDLQLPDISAHGATAPAPAPEPAATTQAEVDRLAVALQALFEARGPRLFLAVEQALVSGAYAHCTRNQVQTARLLGISRNTLRTLLRRHGLLDAVPRAEPTVVPDVRGSADRRLLLAC